MALTNIEYPFLSSPSNTVNVILKYKLNELFKVILSIIKISEEESADRITKFLIKGINIKL